MHQTYEYNPMAGNGRRGFDYWTVWDYRSGRELGRLKYRPQRHGYAVSPGAVSPDGRRFAVAARGVLRMYEIAARD